MELLLERLRHLLGLPSKLILRLNQLQIADVELRIKFANLLGERKKFGFVFFEGELLDSVQLREEHLIFVSLIPQLVAEDHIVVLLNLQLLGELLFFDCEMSIRFDEEIAFFALLAEHVGELLDFLGQKSNSRVAILVNVSGKGTLVAQLLPAVTLRRLNKFIGHGVNFYYLLYRKIYNEKILQTSVPCGFS